MDREVLLHQMTERFQELYNQALDALDHASDGCWITDSAWAFRDAFQQWMKESNQAAMQSMVDAHPTAPAAAFSSCESRVHGPAPIAQQG